MGNRCIKYPCDRETGEIRLPYSVVHELYHLCKDMGAEEAARKIAELTGADKKSAKTYAEQLLKRR